MSCNSRSRLTAKSHQLWTASNFDEFSLRVVISIQLLSTLMQLLFSFDRGMRVEKTLMQTLNSHQLLLSFDQSLNSLHADIGVPKENLQCLVKSNWKHSSCVRIRLIWNYPTTERTKALAYQRWNNTQSCYTLEYTNTRKRITSNLHYIDKIPRMDLIFQRNLFYPVCSLWSVA
jgi:hypothetical protein